ncbi:D-alanine--poly(phosphoribitol) ligase subunit DltC [Vagococcus acidifermentans]|uniref:D-alanyl carrier protein n=1 Tax=Vagococcus acidifermentans TaxID=564710 RepID=A0A430B118_9ENTE|nr:D-alanine--poly(phosphoribitol) ligase subunit DltC [Vagococcus acidifermentans]RSU13912.1 D-alanine--poly(phosphoribitol) ligase subunit 2 [Vagococcus acidifermentans]
MNTKETILNILTDVTGNDEVKTNLDLNLYDEGLLDSMATVQLLVEIDSQCGITVPVSEFDRDDWGTPRQIIDHVLALGA